MKWYFITPLINRIDFISDPRFYGHAEKVLTLRTEKETACGFIDYMVAAERNKTTAPYYLLHEYKREMGALDPKGQLLIAMLAAQAKNEQHGLTQPVYGTFVMGRLWFFVLLNVTNTSFRQPMIALN